MPSERPPHFLRVLELLLENLVAITPELPPANAMCHAGLVDQDRCGRCSRIAAAQAAIALAQQQQAQYWTEVRADSDRDQRLAKRRAVRARKKKAPVVLDDDAERAEIEAARAKQKAAADAK